jgi:PKD repeat protein
MPTRPLISRFLALAAGAALIAGGVPALTVAPANADTAPANGLPSTVTDEPLPTPQIDGVVWTQIVVGNTVYVGGNFTNARPYGSAAGTNTVPRADMLAYDVTTGDLITAFAPTFAGQVRGLAASADGRTIYAVGNFSSVNGVAKNRIVALDATTGAVVSTFKATLNAQALAVTATRGAVYVSGSFTAAGTTAGTSTRNRAAAFDPTTGALLPFAPNVADNDVRGIVVNPDGTRVVLAGNFTTVNGSSSKGSAMVDAATGAVNQPWSVTGTVFNNGANASIYSLSTDGTAVYGTGYSYSAGGQGPLEGMFSADWSTGAIRWIEDCHGDTYSSAAVGGVVYIAGHPHYCGNVVNGYPQSDPWVNQRALAFTTAATGTLRPNTIGGNYVNFTGQPSPTLLDWYPTITQGTFTGQAQGPWSVAANANYVVYGGEFPTVNGVAQQGLVRFAVKTIAPDRDGPRLTATSGTPWTIRANSYDAGSIRVSWPANYDRDNATLTYTLLRDGAVVYTTTATSQLTYKRPVMSFTDTGLANGSTHTYQVRATDPDGNKALSATATATAASTKQVSAYGGTVLADGPSDFWRLDETSGSTFTDAAGPYDLTAQSGVTLGQPGIGGGDGNGTAVKFSGTSTGTSATAVQIGGTDTFSIEGWFKTTTTTGGKIIGLGNSATGSSTVHDRELFLDRTGKVSFGLTAGGTKLVTSPKTYRDNAWHYTAATLGPDGMKLYVDGALVGSNAAVTYGQAAAGYWRVGGDNPFGGDAWFDGTLDDIAVYNQTALTASQIAAHYTAGLTGAIPNAAPTPSFTATQSGLTTALDASASTDSDGTVASYAWSFGDGTTGSGVTTSHTYATPGTYTVTLTATDDGGATASTTRTVTASAPNAAPTASFTTTSDGLAAAFDASGSTDSDGTVSAYAWNYGDGSTGSGRTSSHTYAAKGTYPVTLTVTDDLGSKDTASATVTVAPKVVNQAPTASFTSAATGLVGSFDASASTDPDGVVASYAWSFGDGSTGTGVKPTHQYASAGSYPVSLTVTDDAGATATSTGSITVTAPSGSTPLAADAFGRTVSGGLGTADTGGSWAVTGTASSYSVDGSRAALSTAVGKTLTATLPAVSSTSTDVAATFGLSAVQTAGSVYETLAARQVGSGQYLARAVVSSTGAVNLYLMNGSTALQSVKVAGLTVTSTDRIALRMQAIGTAPTTLKAKIWKAGSAEPADWTLSTTDATAALQAPGTIAIGSYLSSSATGGPITVTVDDLRATDGSGSGAPQNAAPVASFTSSVSGLVASVDGSGSSDSDGTVASYAWDFGDGSATGTGRTTSHTYSAAGSYTVKLTVTDDGGATGSTTKQVTVAAAPPQNASPVAAFTSSVSGLVASVDGSGSSDSDGTIASYAWDFGDGSAAATGRTTSHTYSAAGSYTVKLTVTDDGGATDSTTKQVTVAAAPPQNAAPVASFTSSVSGLVASLDASGSSDSDGTVASYAWDFGDGSAAGSGRTTSHTYAAAGTYTVKLTVTDDGGATDSTTKQVTVAAAADHLAQDAFGRTTASGLGTADVGGAWTVSGTAAQYSTDGAAAAFATPAGKTLSATLNGVTSSSVDVQASFTVPQLPGGSSSYAGLIVRQVGSSSYAVRYTVGTTGKVTVYLLANGTSFASSGVAGLTVQAGDVLHLEAQATGATPTTVSGRLWKDGTDRPTGWQVSATDATAALQKAGSVGITSYLGSTATPSPYVWKVDDFLVDAV